MNISATKELRILHAADLHLDTPFSGLPPEKAALRRKERRALPSRLAELAVRRQAGLTLLAGDLLDGALPYAETVEAAMDALGRIPGPVFIAPGNHDPCAARSPYLLPWPENVHIFRSERIERVPLPALGCVVYGAGFSGPSCPHSLLEGFRTPPSDEALLRVMVLHGEVGGTGYNPITEDQIAASGLHYLALGHIHAFSGIRRAGDTVWAWPGCPEGRGFDETGPRGVILGTLSREGADLSLVPTGQRRYEIVPLAFSGTETPEDAMRALLPALSPQNIYRIVLTGESGPEGIDTALLTKLLEGRCFHGEVRDETRLRRSLWARAGEDSLTGLFLAKLRPAFDAASTDPERAAVERAVRFGLAALEHREDPGGWDGGPSPGTTIGEEAHGLDHT